MTEVLQNQENLNDSNLNSSFEGTVAEQWRVLLSHCDFVR